MMADKLKEKYLAFFERRGHKRLPNVSLIPEDDPSTLFISAGMQPLVPYLLGEPHPLGRRLVSLQRCLRTVDIEKVGDAFHHTFFEMLGNWSLGDPRSPDGVGKEGYWKKEALGWSFEFLTKTLGLDPQRLYVTIFEGDETAPRDEESEKIWLSLGIPRERIYPLPKKDNWWEAGEVGPGGPDSEIFYETGQSACGANCRPGDGCGRFLEIWNNVFMEYNRRPDGSYEKLKQKNVDTGMGVERTTAVLEGKKDVYQTELFQSAIKVLEFLSQRKYQGKNQKPMRVIVDHLRAATFLLADGVSPSNIEQGYVLRRLIRRAVRYSRRLSIEKNFTPLVAKTVITTYQKNYPFLKKNQEKILRELGEEEKRFKKTLERGLRELRKITSTLLESQKKVIPGRLAFYLYETYGFPLELTEEVAQEEGLKVDREGFKKAQKRHQKKSRLGLKRRFAGGLADHSPKVTKYHTATHLLHQALREVLGGHVRQVGSNITSKRLRFDFTHPRGLTPSEIKRVEALVNQKIEEDLPVKMEIMSLEEARKKGALAFFGKKYDQQKVKVYFIGAYEGQKKPYSIEVCAGPHVSSTGEIGKIRIVKEKAVGAGRRRIYAQTINGG